MKEKYHNWRHSFSACFATLIFFLSLGQVYAQQDIMGSVLNIKVSEGLALKLENASFSRSTDNVLLTGIQSIDATNREFQVRGMDRLFRPAGKFEARHRKYGLHRWYQVSLDQASSVLKAIEAFGAIDEVEYSEPIYKKAIIGSSSPDFGPKPLVPDEITSRTATLPGESDDPLLADQWHYNNTGQTNGTPGADISLFQAWGIETGASEVIVAVTDGGIQVDHPDIAANMWVNTGEVPDNDVDDDGNGYVDDINGFGFGDNTGDIAPDAHGTHVGGTIAAVTNNGVGVAGVAGGSGSGDGARLMSCAAFGATGNGGFAEAYVYGADMGAVISQNSWGYTSSGVFEQAVLDGIDYFIAEAGKDSLGNQVGPMNGGIVIFAAGNDDDGGDWYPGFYEETFAVAGTNHNDAKSWYSNFGEWVDIAAPGGETNSVSTEGVLSTLSNNGYGYFQGTSMACPHVSGLAALIVSKFGGPGFLPLMLRDRITSTADNIDEINPDFIGLLGSGRINAFAALQANDSTAPAAITDLSVLDVGTTDLTLTWTAPADEGSGSASLYDMRYSTSPIDEANFDSATPVAGVPGPSIAGQTEEFQVTGLDPATAYYFAIKSSDFFGNNSEISNVLSVSTNEPPVLSLSDFNLEEDLLTAETSVQFLTVSNLGAGPLDFELVLFGPDNFIQVSLDSGSLLPDSSLEVGVQFDATGLLEGTYTQLIQVISNDPFADSVFVTVTLNVTDNGFPITSFTPADSLDFGGLFVGGTKSRFVTIKNSGSEPLALFHADSDNPDFSVSEDTISIAPFQSYNMEVLFSPSLVGLLSGELTIYTSDPADPEHSLTMLGEGLLAPDIEVSPSSLSESLFIDHTSTQLLTISNTGGSDLEFSIEVSSQSEGDSVMVSQISLPELSSAREVSGTKARAASSVAQKSQVEIKWVRQSGSPASVLILTPDSDLLLTALLNGYPDVTAEAFPVDMLPSLTLDQLLAYDIVLTTNNGQWLATGGISPVTVGDLLADYVDGGGKVIVNQFAYSYDAWKMEGRFIDENYGPFTPSTSDQDISVSLDSILAPAHPIIQGVDFITYSGFVQNVGLTPGASAIAAWSNGDLFLAANENVVALNLLPDLGSGDGFIWEGDLGLLYHNAIQYLQGSSFLELSVTEGTLPPGGSLDIDVLFDASGLDAGLYNASIAIETNVPGEELVSVPASLTVLGPEFSVSPDFLDQVLEKGETATQVITLTNNGDETYPYTVDVSGEVQVTDISAVRSRSANIQTIRRTEPVVSKVDMSGISAISPEGTEFSRAASSGFAGPEMKSVQYSTGFEEFAIGDINGQNGWYGEFGNWTAEADSPYEGSQHLRALSDGLGLSIAVTPAVNVGSGSYCSSTMQVNITGSGVTWQLIPQSQTDKLVVTRVQVNPDGTVQALVDDGEGNGVFESVGNAPSGYFELTVIVERATSQFVLLFDGAEVFTGQGFIGNIDEFAFLSAMEVAGPTLDIDNLSIYDGVPLPEFVSVSPSSGNIGAGETVELAVTFDATELEFGQYKSNITIGVSDNEFVVPASLHVIGDPEIQVSPTVIQAEVYYRGDTSHWVNVKNTGGTPLNYSMQVIGANADLNNLPVSPKPATDWRADSRILKKLEEEARMHPEKQAKEKVPADVQLLKGIGIFDEGFEGSTFPPEGWTVIDNEGTGVVWNFASDYGDGNYCGTGEAATVNSDVAGVIEYDTELITPFISTGDFKDIAVQYNANYANIGSDKLDFDIQLEGDSTWTTVLSWNEDHGSFKGLPGEQVIVHIDEYLNGASSFRLRWHYYNPGSGDWDWYAQIDDVVILGDPKAWLTMLPASGSVPVGESVDVEAYFQANEIEDGFYVAGAIISSNAANAPVVGLLASLNVLKPAVIDVEPDSVGEKLLVGESVLRDIIISNNGESPLKYSFGEDLTGFEKNKRPRVSPTETRSNPVESTIPLTDTRSLDLRDAAKALSDLEYETGFEEFATGDINGQEDWAGQFGNWTVEALNAFDGEQHFRGLSDGLGQSLAFSPLVEIGSQEISSMTVMMNVTDEGATWQIIPQSPTAGSVITRFSVGAESSLSTLVSDSLGEAAYVPVPAELPLGYFELRIDVERATSVFTIYFDEVPVFTGQGFAGDIEQVVILSLMEESGPTLDLDNLSIWDGVPQAPWLVLNPVSGIVPSGGYAKINLLLDASDLDKGIYTETLKLFSNDPLKPQTDIPVVLEVDKNIPPELAFIPDTLVIELGELELTFSATDVDDSLLSVSLVDAPSFITISEQGNGFSSYAITPQIGDAGDYKFLVVAEDGRGLTDSAYFKLSVKPFGVSYFSLVNGFTGETVTTFTDSLTLDVNDPDYFSYYIEGTTNPDKVGSVKFTVDGCIRSLDSYAPYKMKYLGFMGLNGGVHELTATAYTEKYGRGDAGQVKKAVINVISSTVVADVKVVNMVGEVLMTLEDSSTIDVSEEGFRCINVVASTDGPTTKVMFLLNGEVVRADYHAPYSLAGDFFGFFRSWKPEPGTYTLTVVPYSGFYPQVQGQSTTVTFEVIDGDGSADARVIGASPDNRQDQQQVSLFPIPTNDEVTLQMLGFDAGNAEIVLISTEGKEIYRDMRTTESLRDQKFSLNRLGLGSGIFYLKIRTREAEFTQKIIKE